MSNFRLKGRVFAQRCKKKILRISLFMQTYLKTGMRSGNVIIKKKPTGQ